MNACLARLPISRRKNKSLSEICQPGNTSAPSKTASSFAMVKVSGELKTATVRSRGSTIQSNRTPAWKYSRRFRDSSARVLPTLNTSITKSGTKSGIGWVGIPFGNRDQLDRGQARRWLASHPRQWDIAQVSDAVGY